MSLVKEINQNARRSHELSSIKRLPSRIALHTHQGISMVSWDNIIYCKADSNYTHVYLTDGRRLVISKTLNYVSAKLPSSAFFRIHKSSLVNLNAVVEISSTSLCLSNQTALPVARGKRKLLLDKIYQISIKV